MAAQTQPSFPIFVISRVLDAVFSNDIAAMPERTPLSTVKVPFQGVNRSCLAWFTSEDLAKKFMDTSKIKGCAVPIRNFAEAVGFPENREF